jgi:hypothetical protein
MPLFIFAEVFAAMMCAPFYARRRRCRHSRRFSPHADAAPAPLRCQLRRRDADTPPPDFRRRQFAGR